jgi:DUF1365 family protein
VNSKLYVGELRHRRTKPKAYSFTYGVYYVDLDLDEIDEVARRIVPLSRNRFNVMSFLDRDHMGSAETNAPATETCARTGTPPRTPTMAGDGVRAAVRARLAARGIDPDAVRVSLLTNTRILGYVFNPVSFYLVRDRADDALRTVLAEVHNTHGEEHVYDLERVDDGAVYTSRAQKVLYVSPFIDMDARYVFECREGAGGAYDLRIDEYQGDELFFQAQLRVSPRPLTNANVARMLARYPFMTLKTIGLIHWQGLKLWLRGVKFHSHKAAETP